MAKLLYRDLQGRSAAVDLPSAGAVLGRGADCIIRSDDPTVSRAHARLCLVEGRWHVEDMSTGGTFLNDQRVLQRHALTHDDVIRCGTLQVRFVEPPAAVEGAGGPARQPPLIGAYRLIRPLGEGGMGVVFEAEHQQIGRRVALKLLHAELAQQGQWAARFLNEARAVHLIRHPGIVDISDIGQLPDGRLFIVMELLQGEPLRQYEERTGKLPLPLALFLCYQIAAALQATHERGIVHRDLKPDNVFLVPDPLLPEGLRTKLLDFGIAKMTVPGGGGARTETGMLMGTPRYMSPEQCGGGAQVDGQTDVYSLGVMLYEMLAGAPPFHHPTPVALMTMHVLQPPRPMREVEPGLPEVVASLVDQMLSKAPEARPTMAQVTSRLQHLIRDGLRPPPEAPPPPPARSTPAPVETRASQGMVRIDPRPLLGPAAPSWEQPAPEGATVHEFLSAIWSRLPRTVPSFSYGERWVLRDPEAGALLRQMGTIFARRRTGQERDARTLKEVWIRPGMRFELVDPRAFLEGRLVVRQGDIVEEATDAIVTSADPSFIAGGGVNGAIHRAAGPELQADCLRLRGTPAGEARITPGHRLPARYVIHTVGPVWRGGGAGEEALLARCHRSCLELAAQHRVGTVAFPAISTGAFGFPLERAAQVAVSATRDALQGLPGIRQVIFVCFDEESFSAYYREAVYGDGPR